VTSLFLSGSELIRSDVRPVVSCPSEHVGRRGAGRDGGSYGRAAAFQAEIRVGAGPRHQELWVGCHKIAGQNRLPVRPARYLHRRRCRLVAVEKQIAGPLGALVAAAVHHCGVVSVHRGTGHGDVVVPLHVAAVYTTEFATPGGVVGVVPVVVVGGVVAQDYMIAEEYMDTAGAVVVGDVVLDEGVVGVCAVGAAVLGISEIIDDQTVTVGSVGRIAVVPKDVPADDDMETGFPVQRDRLPEGNAALAPRARQGAVTDDVVLHGAIITMVELNPAATAVMNVTVLDDRMVIEDVLDSGLVGLNAGSAWRRDVESVQGDVICVFSQSKRILLLRGHDLCPVLARRPQRQLSLCNPNGLRVGAVLHHDLGAGLGRVHRRLDAVVVGPLQRDAQDNLIAACLEPIGIKGVSLMELLSALVWPEVLRDPIDEGINGSIRQHYQVRGPCLGIWNEQLLLDPSPGRHCLPILGLLIGMAGRRAVILEKFSDSQFDFSLSFGQPQVAGNGLFENPRRLKPQDRCTGRLFLLLRLGRRKHYPNKARYDEDFHPHDNSPSDN
jgi:hypothetical protein